MPTRRRFLQGMLGGACLATLAPDKLVAETPEARSPDLWALLADTHISGKKAASGALEHLVKVREDILSGQVGAPRGMILCGDCAHQRGLPEDYSTLLRRLNPLRQAGLQLRFVVGNHDERRAFLEAVAGEQNAEKPDTIPERLNTIFETPRANFFLLDSLIRTDHSPGRFGREQLDWLADELDARKDKPAIIVAHHYPDYSAAVISNPHALQDTGEFFERIRSRKQVKAYLFGHAHVWKRLRRYGIHLVNIPATSWHFDPTQPLGWVLMRLRDDGMTLTLRSIDPTHPKHNEQVELAWRPG